MRKYWTTFSISLQQVLQLRATLLMDRVGGLAVLLSLYYFWDTLMGQGKSFLGYTREQMLSYVLLMNVLRSFVFTGRGWQLVGEISSGRISSYLVRPISYHGYALAMDLSQKALHAAASIVEISLLMLVFRAPIYLPDRWETWLLFIMSVALSSLLFFFLEFIVASLAFWTSESGGPLFVFELSLQFAAGTFFPLDVLPRALRSALELTPFPYMVFFPINVYLERVSPAEAVRLIGIQGAWLMLCVWAALALWRKGLDNYSAEGG